jgi:peptide chain release factor 1
MLDDWNGLEEKYRRLTLSLSDPAALSDPRKLKELSKERAELEPLVRKYEDLKRARKSLADSRAIAADPEADPDLRKLAQSELDELAAHESRIQDELQVLLLPKDPLDEKDVLLEIRAGAGGDEASLFAQDLVRMYGRFAESKGWKFEVVETSQSPIGGFKEAIALIKGKRVYSVLKYESGVHRVQRVPKTEASGRIHTSTVTVAVLPEADEVDVKLDPNDLRIEAFGASGPGGQNVNRNYTAIRVTHKPSGLVVSCQDEKSQHRNKEKALKILRARLLDIARRRQQEEIAETRKSQVGTGERSEKIRTYNFAQSRVTDHRLNRSWHNLESVLDGDLDDVTKSLVLFHQAQQLGQAEAGRAARDNGL